MMRAALALVLCVLVVGIHAAEEGGAGAVVEKPDGTTAGQPALGHLQGLVFKPFFPNVNAL